MELVVAITIMCLFLSMVIVIIVSINRWFKYVVEPLFEPSDVTYEPPMPSFLASSECHMDDEWERRYAEEIEREWLIVQSELDESANDAYALQYDLTYNE